MPTDIAQLVASESEQDRLMESARAAIKAMWKSRRRQLLAELVRQVEADALAPQPEHAVKQNAASTPRVLQPVAAPKMPMPGTSPRILTGAPVNRTNRDMITAVLRAARPMVTGDVVAAVRTIKPDANYGSIASELARMRGATPPLLVSTGKTPGGYDLWGLPPAQGGQVPTR